jgi:hypothetical protein
VSGPPDCAHDAGTVICTLGSLDSGAGAQSVIQVSVDADFQGVLTNTASVVATQEDPDVTNNSDQELTEVRPRLVFLDGFESGDLTGWGPARGRI